jgi:hypothetical protein
MNSIMRLRLFAWSAGVLLASGCGSAQRPRTADACEARAAQASEAQRAELDDPAAGGRREGHLVWLAAHCPDRDQTVLLSYAGPPPAAVVNAWQAQVDKHPDDAQVLGNTASLFVGSDDARALALYERAEAAEPDNPRWPELQANIHHRKARFERADDAHAVQAYTKFLRAAELADDVRRFDLQGSLAEAAFAAKNTPAAKTHASEILLNIATMPKTWNTGNLIHDAHATLGRIALAEGDVAAAKAHLLDAGRTPGSPQLGSFGPDLRLAAELLAAGERDAVLEYLDLCAIFWEDGKDDLDEWRAALRRGETPRLR